MKTQHTKGPWMDKEGQIYPETTGKTLALIPYFDKSNDEENANARLIAAAPELLEALINLKEQIYSLSGLSFWQCEIDDMETKEMLSESIEAINKAIEG